MKYVILTTPRSGSWWTYQQLENGLKAKGLEPNCLGEFFNVWMLETALTPAAKDSTSVLSFPISDKRIVAGTARQDGYRMEKGKLLHSRDLISAETLKNLRKDLKQTSRWIKFLKKTIAERIRFLELDKSETSLFKLMAWDYLFQRSVPIALSKECNKIILLRRNIRLQLLSYCLAQASGRWGDHHSAASMTKASFTGKKIWFKQMYKQLAYMKVILAYEREAPNTRIVFYEDLLACKSEAKIHELLLGKKVNPKMHLNFEADPQRELSYLRNFKNADKMQRYLNEFSDSLETLAILERPLPFLVPKSWYATD